jgi:maltose alpha-D-glucosyltransferase/alpha-amylase
VRRWRGAAALQRAESGVIDDLWYKNAIVYCLDVETFMDGNADGVGDFIGLRRRLDYLAGLGVTCVWLLPFYATPNRDNGYDVSDYYAIDSRLGTLGDFVEFSHEARLHGIRVIIDLVANHTSDQHPWFQEARRDPRSRYRDFYVWSGQRPPDADSGLVFPGIQTSTWSWDDAAQAWFFHRFFEFQPDLNVANPAVRAEILKVVGFWLELGVSGFRVDAVPFLIERQGTDTHEEQERARFEMLDELREFLSWRRGDGILLAEANVPMADVGAYFDDGRRMQMVFDFISNQALFLSLADEDARPLRAALASAPPLRDTAQWAHFLRNHDELDLGRLAPEERRRVFEAFGPEPRMELYGRGLRRRLAPMLSGDPRRLALAYSLLFTLPGTAVLWYGEEIGMGEDLGLEGRDAVRTPMQWSSGPHGGFTAADPFRPVVASGPFGCEHVSVAAQRRDPDSLLNRIERMIRLRKECPEIGWGTPRILEVEARSVLALRYEWRGSLMIVVHNLSAEAVEISLDADTRGAPVLVDALSGERVEADGRLFRIAMRAHGFFWFHAGERDAALGASPR